MNLFNLNYDQISGYKNIKVNFYDFVYTNLRFFFSYIISFAWIHLMSKQRKVMELNNNDSFTNDGVVGIRNDELVNFLKIYLKTHIAEIQQRLKKIPLSERKIEHCINGIHKNKNKNIYKSIEKKIFNVSEIKSIIDNFFNFKKANLVHFNIHINDQDDKYVFKHDENDVFDDEMNFFHVDTNLNTLKMMIYLTDVKNIDHGAFEYVVGSQKLFNLKHFIIRRVIRKIGAYKRDERGKRMILSLPKKMRLKNDFSDYPKNSMLGKYVKSKSKSFISEKNIIIFDPLGIHRGGRVKEGKRIALQLVFSTDNFSWLSV